MERVPVPDKGQAASFSSVTGIVKGLLSFALGPGLALLFAGTWSWPEAWIYSFVHILMSLPVLVYLKKHNPGLLDERARFLSNPGTKSWDKYFVGAYTATYPLEFVVAGLDRRYSASWWNPLQLYPFTRPLIRTGFVLVFGGYAIVAWAMCVNR